MSRLTDGAPIVFYLKRGVITTFGAAALSDEPCGRPGRPRRSAV